MDKIRQIEEMANIIALKAFERAHEINGDENLADIVATELYDNGYCKASELAREILAEIERMCFDPFGIFNHRAFAKLKKKYTEQE